MVIDFIDDGIKLISSIVDAAFPTTEAKASAEAKLLQAQADAYVNTLRAQQAVMLAEASSQDPWTSRARPSFLWVVYLLLLWSLPMSFVFAFSPETATKIVAGFGQWMSAIPNSITNLFETVMLGYTAGRTLEKVTPHITSAVKK
jgi:hypothetical protein